MPQQHELAPKEKLGRSAAESLERFIEKTPKELMLAVKRESALHRAFWPRLDAEHETHRKVQEVMEHVSQVAGFPENYFNLVVFKCAFPNAEIHPHTKEIRISDSLIAAVGGDAEKLAAVLAHEIGHIVMAHFDKTPAPGAESSGWDPLNERIQGYEGEYQADRTALILSGRLGVSRDAVSGALADLYRSIEDINAGVDSDDADKFEMEFKDLDLRTWATSTHPHLPRRIIAIKRDALWLPKIKKAYNGGDIPVPQAEDFAEVREDLWESDIPGIYSSDTSGSIDCLWREVGLEDVEEEDERFQSVAPEDVLERFEADWSKSRKASRKTPVQLESVPEEVAAWDESNVYEIDEWWLQSMGQVDGLDGYQDLSDDIAQYDLRTVRLILSGSRPELSYLNEFMRKSGTSFNPERFEDEKTKDAIKDHVQTMLIGGREDIENASMSIITALLIRRWFELDGSLAAPEGIREYIGFLERFESEHGVAFTYDGGRFFRKVEEVFAGLGSEAEKEQFVSLIRENERLIFASLPKRHSIAREMMPRFYAWVAQKQGDGTLAKPKPYVEQSRPLYQLPPAVGEAAEESQEISPDEARAALGLIRSNFRLRNMTFGLAGIAIQHEKKVNEEGYSDAYLESNPHASAGYLSSEEFDEKYFGQGRTDYVKAEYGGTDQYIREYQDVYKLWQRAGYDAEFRALPPGPEKLRFLLESFPACSARRDRFLIEALGWKELANVEDVVGTQADIIAVDDAETLFALENRFFSPILNLAVSQRLWSLCQSDPGAFHSLIPATKLESIRVRLADFPSAARSEELTLILACFNSPSYFRDDLLRKLVDAAPDREATLSLSSLYCDPPVGSFSAHESETISMSESLLDVADSLPVLDKQELLLYFMGSRCFYSSIDYKYFQIGDEDEVIEMRRHAIFKGRKSFLKKYEEALSDMDGDDDEDDNEKRELVGDPDSLMFLRKASGVPVEVLLKQQKSYTTKREQRNLIARLIGGNRGVLSADKEPFLKVVAENIVAGSEWSKDESSKQRKNISDFLEFALNRCPEKKLPDMFLGLWNMQMEHQELPEVIAALLRELGPIFIKTGQYLGTQSAALPPDWIRAFRGLADQNLRAEKTMVYEHEIYEYGQDSPFASIGAKQGEGSMAAVYQATKQDGSRVAAKVIHPCIEDELPDDVQFLDDLVGYINRHKKIFGLTLPENLADVIEGQIIKELSFENIVGNNAALQQSLSKSGSAVKWNVPRVQKDASRSDFIVFDFSDGQPLDTLEGEARQKVYSEIGLELMRQVLFEGVFQGDPNIGNFRVRTEGQKLVVDWLDTDHLGRLDQAEAKQLRSLVKELALSKRPKKVAEILASFVATSDPAGIAPDLEKWISEGRLLAQEDSGDMEKILTSFLDLLAEKGMFLKDQYVTLIRALGLMKPFLEQISSGQSAKFFAKLAILG